MSYLINKFRLKIYLEEKYNLYLYREENNKFDDVITCFYLILALYTKKKYLSFKILPALDIANCY